MFLVDYLKSAINFLSAPQFLVTAALIGLVLMIHWRRVWTPKGGLILLVLIAGRNRALRTSTTELQQGRRRCRTTCRSSA